MHGTFASFAGRLRKTSKNFIDNSTFRLHYRVTFTILIICSLLCTLNQYFGDPIMCMASGVPGGIMNTYCWIHGTFTVPARLTGVIGQDMPHPGIGPTTDPNLIRINDDGEEIRHAWYQWTAFALFLQALMVYTPHYLWKSWENGKISMMIQDLDEKKLDDTDTKKDRRMATMAYFKRTLHSHKLYVT